MKKRFLIQILLIFLAYSAQVFSQTSETINSILITAKPTKLTKNEWQFEVNIQNKNQKAIYLATEPTQVNGEKGQYLLLDRKDKSLLNVSTRVFSLPIIDYYSNETRIKLIKLQPNEIYAKNISLKFPTTETAPPRDTIPDDLLPEIKNKVQNKNFTDEDFRNLGFNILGKKINSEKIKSVIISYGYFIEEQGIVDFLKRKPMGWFIKGNEKIFVGNFREKQFYEVQNIVSSNTIKIIFDSKK
ncbi:MAG: hypothetical protein M3367_07890 [Acidobacteriota bacterium]|nr:hypothetical protein [Acidobacteriota bacterium]